MSFPVAFLALAVLPGICEDIVFRGPMLTMLGRGMSATAAVVTQAVFFGFMHGSLFRLVPTGVLGLVFGIVAYLSGSIWPSMIAHVMTNGIGISAPPSSSATKKA